MTEKIDSIKHPKDTRVHIPNKEEAGYEDGNDRVQAGKKTLELPVNPVTTRGHDPELFWMNKYGNDDREELLLVDIRSLYRHEHIAPETLIKNLYRVVETDDAQADLFGSVNDLFGNALDKDELEKVSDYYRHHDGWTNRLIQGDSHLVTASLLEREGMAGQGQMIYMDPPYGVKYGSNWQIKLNNRSVKEGDDDLTGEPEVIKAFRDTWELGVHSYLSYIRDRLLIAKELLTESGSCFVQISDENVHLVRNVMDEVFGSENFCCVISFVKTCSSALVLMVTVAEDAEGVARAVSSGARGYVVKDATREEMAAAVVHALSDAVWRRPIPAPRSVESSAAAPALTEREMQVLTGMSRGRSNAEIGKELFLSEDTVKTHARRLFRKLDAADRAQAVAVGFRWGLVR